MPCVCENCGQPTYDCGSRLCDNCFLDDCCKTDTEKNMFLQGNFYKDGHFVGEASKDE